MTKALDPASFALVQEPLTDPEVLAAAVLVDQTAASAPAVSATNQLLSATSARAVAVVDRTADVDAAARHIATARFAFAGHSPYAPDLVLVNEFVKRDFFEACTRYTTLAFAREGPAVAGAGAKLTGNTEEEVRTAVREAEKKMQVSSFGSAEFKLVDILDP